MGKRKRNRRKLPGHFCWSCECRRRNEKFSGKGHARHVCKDCQKLGEEELTYRQAQRDIERCFTWEGGLRKKMRKVFEKFLASSNPRIQAYALHLKQENDSMKEGCYFEPLPFEDSLEDEACPSEPEFPV